MRNGPPDQGGLHFKITWLQKLLYYANGIGRGCPNLFAGGQTECAVAAPLFLLTFKIR
jgi:hypothetical protein